MFSFFDIMKLNLNLIPSWEVMLQAWSFDLRHHYQHDNLSDESLFEKRVRQRCSSM